MSPAPKLRNAAPQHVRPRVAPQVNGGGVTKRSGIKSRGSSGSLSTAADDDAVSQRSSGACDGEGAKPKAKRAAAGALAALPSLLAWPRAVPLHSAAAAQHQFSTRLVADPHLACTPEQQASGGRGG